MMGTINRLIRDKGFGFIRDTEGMLWFFHRSAVRGGDFERLQEGQAVRFDPEDSPKGPLAVNVQGQPTW